MIRMADGPFRWWVPLVAYAGMMALLIVTSLTGLPPQLAQMAMFVGYALFATAVAMWAGPNALGLKQSVALGVIVVVVALATAGTSLIEVVGRMLSPDIAESTEKVLTSMGLGSGALNDLALIITICCLAPIGEEAIFRGLIFKGIYDPLRRMGGVIGGHWIAFAIAAVASAVIFAQTHGGEGQEAAVIIAIGLSGVIYALCYAVTGTIWAAVLAHSFNNTVAMATALWPAGEVSMTAKAAVAAMPILVLALLWLWSRIASRDAS